MTAFHTTLIEEPVLDPAVLAEIRALATGGEDDAIMAITQVFMADAPDRVVRLGAAIAARDVNTVRRIAHRLRGGALALGAGRMARVCTAIEQAAVAESIDEAARQWPGFSREFEAVKQALLKESHR